MPHSTARTAWPLLVAVLSCAVGPAAAQRVVDLPARDRAAPGTLTDVWTVGAAMGRDWEQFNGVAGMTFDRHDNLFVVDRGSYRVLQYDAGGRFVRQFGSQGGGPGEFNLPLGVAVTADGSVVVADMMGGYEVFEADGSFRHTLPYPDGIRSVEQLTAHPREGVVGRSTLMATLGPGGDMSALQRPIPVRVFQQPVRADAPVAVLHEHHDPPPQVQQAGGAGERRVMVRVGPTMEMFAPTFSWGVLPGGGVATLNGTAYAIRITDARGMHVATLRRPLEPRPVTDRVQRQARAAERARLERGESAGGPGMTVTMRDGAATFGTGGGAAALTREQIDQRLADMTFAGVVPAARRLATDPAGRIWVERYAADYATPGPVDLLTADGRYLGTLAGIPLPEAVSATGLAAWVERDELDVERIVVRRLPGTWR